MDMKYLRIFSLILSVLMTIAILGGCGEKCYIPDEKIEEVCAEVSKMGKGVVVPANYNCPGQLVISGNIEAIEEACKQLSEAGAKRALVLKVGGAFHSPLMQPAKDELQAAIQATEIKTPKCPVYQNVTAKPSTDPAEIKANLLAQLTSPVRWTQSVKNMMEDGADHFTELGPGAVLQGLVAKIASSPLTIDGFQSL